MTHRILGNVVQKRRDALGLTQREVEALTEAKAVKVHAITISKIERGECLAPGLPILFALADALRIDPRKLIR